MRNRTFLVILMILLLIVMTLASGCSKDNGESPDEASADAPAAEEEMEEQSEPSGTEDQSEPSDTEGQSEPEDTVDQSELTGMRAEFQDTVDSYETLMDEYFEFMKSFDENDEDQMTEFNEIMSRYYEIIKQIDEWEKTGLSGEERVYLEEAYERVGEKQLEADIAKG